MKAIESARWWVDDAGEGNHGWDGVAQSLQTAVDSLEALLLQLEPARRACDSAVAALTEMASRRHRNEVMELLSAALVELEAAVVVMVLVASRVDEAVQACLEAGGVQKLQTVLHALWDEQIDPLLAEVQDPRDAVIMERRALDAWGKREHDGGGSESPADALSASALGRTRNPSGCTGLPEGRDPRDSSRFSEPASASARASAAYARIVAADDDVPAIAENTGYPIEKIAVIKRHLFLTQHETPTGADQVVRGYFTPVEDTAQLWEKGAQGTLDAEEEVQLDRLLRHEYIEARLMQQGLPYRSSHPQCYGNAEEPEVNTPTREHFGAHDLAPRSGSRVPFSHWPKIWGREGPARRILEDPNRLDEVVETIVMLQREIKNDGH